MLKIQPKKAPSIYLFFIKTPHTRLQWAFITSTPNIRYCMGHIIR
uniref:Uncharacterized protein n=1 Tax=Anguilla anguilla TaxID=7936 RepID=A0A0E9XIA8_ANGAN